MSKKKKEIQTFKEIVHILGAVTLFLGPLILYFVNDEKEVKKETKKVLNWQFSLLIYLIVAQIIDVFVFRFVFLSVTNLLILANLVLSIIGFVKVHNKEKWDYPLTFEFLK